MQKLKVCLLFLTLLFPSLPSKAARSTSQQADMKPLARAIPFCLPLTDEYDLGAVLKSLASDTTVSYPQELGICIKKMDAGKTSVSSKTLKPLMPYIIKYLAPQFLENIYTEDALFDDGATRAPRVKEGCQESINLDVIKPVTHNNVDTGIIVRLLCQLQKDIDKQFKFLCKKIENIEEELDEIFDTLTECCDDLSNQVDDVSDQLDECCSEILDTLTKCCNTPYVTVEEVSTQPAEE